MKRGLPTQRRMRHDAHFVDELANRSTTQIGMILPLEAVDPNPDQPRVQLGEIEELANSIREKGVLEPILVRSIGDDRYQIISGERRYRAATMAGLEEIPAIEIDADDREVLEIALIENIQRKDLTPFEEADGFLLLQEKFDYTHEQIARVIGKSRTTITEALQIAELPQAIRRMATEAGITRKSVLVQIARAGSEETMAELVRSVAAGEIDRADLRRKTAARDARKPGRPKHFTYQVKDRDLPFRLNLSFRKAEVDKSEIVSALRQILERLEGEE